MNSVHFERFPENECPALELNTTNFTEPLSDEYICGKVEVEYDSVQIEPKLVDPKTEDCTDSEEILSNFTVKFEPDEKV